MRCSKTYKIEKPIFKKAINSIFFYVLKESIVFLSKRDKTIKEWIKSIKTNSIKMKILEKGAEIELIKRGDFFEKGKGKNSLEVFFKNTDSAFLMMTAQIGPEQGFAEHRLILKGNIADAILFTAVLKKVEAILFPGIFHKKLFRKKPALSFNDYLNRVFLYLLIPLLLIKYPWEK